MRINIMAGTVFNSEDFYVHLSSIGDGNRFIENRHSEFVNDMVPPIALDGKWVVGGVDIHVPQIKKSLNAQFTSDFNDVLRYRAPSYKYKYTFSVWIETMAEAPGSEVEREIACIYNPVNDITGNTFATVLEALDKDIRKTAREQGVLDTGTQKLFSLNRETGRVTINPFKWWRKSRVGAVSRATIVWRASPHMSMFLGLGSKCTCKYDSIEKYITPEVPVFDHGISHLMLYLDIIEPTRFGNSKVSISNIIPLVDGKISTVGKHVPYNTVKRSSIDSISARITDEKGHEVEFERSGTSTITLHFRRTDY